MTRAAPRSYAAPCALLALAWVCLGSQPTQAQPIGGSRWHPIGPAPIGGFFPGGVAGRASAIAINPLNYDQVFLGTASGGVWYSPNGGLTWIPISDRQASLAIGDIVPADCTALGCSKLYVGTGENAIRRDTYYGRGLLVGTLDFGTWNWQMRGNSLPHDFTGASITDVVRAPTGSPPRLFLSVSSGVTTSSAQTSVTAPPSDIDTYGIYRSDDDGVSWTRLSVTGSNDLRPTDLEMHPVLSGVLYAGFLERGLFRTVDGGDNWCPLTLDCAFPPCPPVAGCPAVSWTPSPPQAYDHVEIAIATGSILYASFGSCPDQLFRNCVPSVYRSDDAGSSWTRMSTGTCNHGSAADVGSGYSRYTHLLAVSPHDEDELWLGGIKLWRSPNGGDEFFPADGNTAGDDDSTIHLDHHEMVFHPTIPGRAYETSDGGVAVLVDGKWTPLNHTLQTIGFQGIAVSPLTGFVIGGAQDNSGSRWEGTDVWEVVPSGGDGGNVVIDSGNPQVVYVGTNYGGVRGSLNGGNSFCTVKQGTLDTSEPKAFYAPIVQGPPPDRTIYTASNRLYKGVRVTDRCYDGAFSFMNFVPISPPALAPDDLGGQAQEICRKRVLGFCTVDCNGENVITAIGAAPGDPDRVYVGYYGGQIFVTSDATAGMPSWDDITDTLPARPITRIAVDPDDDNTILVSQGGFSAVTTNLWRGVVAGSAVTWTASGFGLPAGVPVNTVHYEPGFPDIVWAGLDGNETINSLYRSSDSGLNWVPHSTGLPNVPVYDIAFDSFRRRAFAGTHGRGTWSIGGPSLVPWEDWEFGERSDVAIYGMHLNDSLQPISCQMDLFTTDGQLCASSDKDAVGATLLANQQGKLRADLGGIESPVIWACKNGMCVDGVPISACGTAQDPLQRVEVSCGNELAVQSLVGPGVVSSPPSSTLSYDLGGSLGPGTATLQLALHSGDGQSSPLCSVPLDLDPGADPFALFDTLAKAIEADSNCASSGLLANVDFNPGSEEEDDFAREPSLNVQALNLVGTQVVTGVAVAPGAAVGACLEVRNLGNSTAGQLVPAAVEFTTGPSGAAGGSLSIGLRSPAGECRLDLLTAQGDSAANIAGALATALAQGGGSACPAEQLARDATAIQDRVRLPLTRSIRLCMDDTDVGFNIQSQDIANNHPVAAMNAQVIVDCAAPNATTVVLDGSGSTDSDSTPGTADDIATYDWYQDFGQPSQVLLGSGPNVQVVLPFPSVTISLVVGDTGGLNATSTMVVDTIGGTTDTDQDGYPDLCDNCPGTQNDQTDTDQDGHGDDCDCAINDDTLLSIPTEVTDLNVDIVVTTTTLTWTDERPNSGSATVHDVITGLLSDLSATGTYGAATCLTADISTPTTTDPTLDPALNETKYYLARAHNTCGNGTYGNSTTLPDPRDTLDTTSPCP